MNFKINLSGNDSVFGFLTMSLIVSHDIILKTYIPSCIECTQSFNIEIKVFTTLEAMYYTSKERKATI